MGQALYQGRPYGRSRPDPSWPWARVVAAIVDRAIEDLESDNQALAREARAFLGSGGFAWLMSLSGLDPGYVRRIWLQDVGRWVTIGEGSELSGYSARHLRDLVRTGAVEGDKGGGRWLVNLDSLEEYQQGRG